jgi:hypothetical protein
MKRTACVFEAATVFFPNNVFRVHLTFYMALFCF